MLSPPCLIFEDEHLLVVNKPAGWNTHSPAHFSGEGLYDWLRNREPRWSKLAIIHRLDKETSGVIVFAKTKTANRSLTEQFTQRRVKKKYLLLTDRPVAKKHLTIESALVRVGDKYVSRPAHPGSDLAETRFQLQQTTNRGLQVVQAEPLTGRTHQIRVHAAASGFPILGDTSYGGSPAERVFLHAMKLVLQHPATGKELTFEVPPDFDAEPRLTLRTAFIEDSTDAFRIVHGASDGWPDWYLDRLGRYLLSQSERPLNHDQLSELKRLMDAFSCLGAYHKLLTRQVRRTISAQASPRLVLGAAAPERFVVQENGLQFEMSFNEGYSVGLFLDQRDNRRRLLNNYVAGGFPLFQSPEQSRVLNTFAYTCGFSCAAAKAGASTTSLDLSKKYLEWGKRNFALNQLDPSKHDFIYGDVLDWLRRLHKKNRLFDLILLDPPTFSQSKESGPFRAEKDYPKLVSEALPVLKPGGVLFASSNAADWLPGEFVSLVRRVVTRGKRTVLQEHYFPQPPDFPISRQESGYLKTLWLRIG